MSGGCSGSDSEEPIAVSNRFANDGSFLEMFKQMQRNSHHLNTTTHHSSDTTQHNTQHISTSSDQKKGPTVTPTPTPTPTTTHSTPQPTQLSTSSKPSDTQHNKCFININKRRTKTLKTGLIKKQRIEGTDAETDSAPTDHWNRYMSEVRKYKEKYGDDNDKNRPLVK